MFHCPLAYARYCSYASCLFVNIIVYAPSLFKVGCHITKLSLSWCNKQFILFNYCSINLFVWSIIFTLTLSILPLICRRCLMVHCIQTVTSINNNSSSRLISDILPIYFNGSSSSQASMQYTWITDLCIKSIKKTVTI